jgi:plastocyanin
MIPSGRRGRRTRNLPADGPPVAAGAVAILLAASLLAGCDGSTTASASADRPGGSGTATTSGSHHRRQPKGLRLSADPTGRLRYIPNVLHARPGHLTINFVNHSETWHNLHVASPRGVVLGATPTFSGGTRTLTLTLKPGRYIFYCTVPGHRFAGMHGTLIIR